MIVEISIKIFKICGFKVKTMKPWKILKLRLCLMQRINLKIIQNYSKKYKNIAIISHAACLKQYSGYTLKNG